MLWPQTSGGSICISVYVNGENRDTRWVTGSEGWNSRHTTCDRAYRRGAHCRLWVQPASGFLWFTSVIKTMNGSFTCTRLLHFAVASGVKTYTRASPPWCHVVWLWLDLKAESLRLIKNKYTAAHTGYKSMFWRPAWGAAFTDCASAALSFLGVDLVSLLLLPHVASSITWTRSFSPELTTFQRTLPLP